MNVYAPAYYTRFKCTTGRCRHTCCAGWEIDIDDATLAKYNSIGGNFGERLRNSIDYSGTPHFMLEEGDKCPFLNDEKLCDIIIRLGEDNICDICRDHPRFRNFWSGRIEIGLGLACESACRLILSDPEPLRITRIDGNDDEALNDEEIYLMSVRCELLDAIGETGYKARLKEYLIYRHLADALYDDRLEERIKFTERAYEQIIKSSKSDSIDDVIESARIFSNNVEYDDETLEVWISGKNG